MIRHHLAVWATHPLLHGWHRAVADLCRWPVLVAAGLVAYTAVVATWAVGTVVLFAFGQLVVVPRVTGHAARAHHSRLSPAGVHRWTPSRQVPPVQPTPRFLPGRAPVEVAR